jgi:hypothetical protein
MELSGQLHAQTVIPLREIGCGAHGIGIVKFRTDLVAEG